MSDHKDNRKQTTAAEVEAIEELRQQLAGIGARVTETTISLSHRIKTLEICIALWKNRVVGALWVIGGVFSIALFLIDRVM